MFQTLEEEKDIFTLQGRLYEFGVQLDPHVPNFMKAYDWNVAKTKAQAKVPPISLQCNTVVKTYCCNWSSNIVKITIYYKETLLKINIIKY